MAFLRRARILTTIHRRSTKVSGLGAVELWRKLANESWMLRVMMMMKKIDDNHTQKNVFYMICIASGGSCQVLCEFSDLSDLHFVSQNLFAYCALLCLQLMLHGCFCALTYHPASQNFELSRVSLSMACQSVSLRRWNSSK